MSKAKVLLLASAAMLITTGAAAQAGAPATMQDASGVSAAATDKEQSAEVVVTAVAKGRNKLDSSISVSSLSADEIATAAPRSVAELFRSLPGIRSESSGGEGNANIQSRGIPISTGGAKFLQLQEDGLPVLEFGDIAFGNADIFTRADFNVARVESVRGGSASTFASNSPGGVINLISKTGATTGGSVQGTIGLDYGEYRLDGDYGASLGDGWSFHAGGFYRQGEGPRRVGYDGNKGGQVRGNLTKTFNDGFFRLNFKYLDDKAVGYLPSPVLVTGTNSNPNWKGITGLSPNGDAIQSKYFTSAIGLNGANQRVTDDIRDGMHPVVKALGFEAQFDVADGWTVNNKFRWADISGRFIAPFTASVDTAQNLANSIGGAGSTLRYATGPQAGTAIAAPGSLNGNGLAQAIVLFNTKLNSLDNIANDFRITHTAELGGGTLDVTAGFYKSRQKINMDWLWNSYLLEVKGDNAALLDVFNAGGVKQTEAGVVAYGANFFGNCCRRSYNLSFDTNAPFASLSYNADRLTLDGSIRYDAGSAGGFVIGDGPVTSFDVNGNGTIAVPETKTTVIPAAIARRPVDYNYHYWSYSAGANYRLSDDFALFGRYSRGGRANADRYVFGGNTSPTTGKLLPNAKPVDFVRQAELGLKYQSGPVRFYSTAFWARTQEQSYEATTQTVTANTYRAYGLELEGSYRIGGFSLSASGTYTNARIVASLTPAVVGNRPRRQANFIYRIAPEYTSKWFSLGASVVGTGASYAQDVNLLKLPAFAQVNAFVAVRPIDRVQLSINANNLFDTTGFTEAEEGAIPGNGLVRARSINGRTISASLRLDF